MDERWDIVRHFEVVHTLIQEGRSRALQLAYAGQLKVYWSVGGYVHHKLVIGQYGDRVMIQLAAWLKEKEPTLKGFDVRSLYRMRDFYECWYAFDWKTLEKDGSVKVGSSIPFSQSIENEGIKIVGLVIPLLENMPPILGRVSWSHHLEILKRAKSMEENVFYLLLTIKEGYTVQELMRQIKSSIYERQKMSSQRLLEETHPGAVAIPRIFRDRYIFEFLDLQEPFSENDMQKGLVRQLKRFVLELGKDFIFMGEEFRIRVGNNDYFIDLLFFHRELQCMVAFDLKVTEFEPEYLGKLNFYLEALDQDVKKPHENPSIGVLLVKAKDKEVVRYAMNRNLSPALVADYETKMIDKKLLQQLLHEWSKDAGS